jgi:hypothetical protein
VVAVNLTGVASNDTPAVMPNQIKQTQAGFLSIVITYFRVAFLVGMIPHLFSVPGKGKLRYHTVQAKRYDLRKRIATGIRRIDDQTSPFSEQPANRRFESLSGKERIVARTTAA